LTNEITVGRLIDLGPAATLGTGFKLVPIFVFNKVTSGRIELK